MLDVMQVSWKRWMKIYYYTWFYPLYDCVDKEFTENLCAMGAKQV